MGISPPFVAHTMCSLFFFKSKLKNYVCQINLSGCGNTNELNTALIYHITETLVKHNNTVTVLKA